MLYKTTTTWEEDGYGIVEDVILVSDNFDDLVNYHLAVEVNLFTKPSVKRAIDLDVGVVSTENMRFFMNAYVAETDDEKDAVDFVLAARDRDVPRYVARILNPGSAPITDETDFLFRGKLDSAMEAKEGKWSGSEYSSTALPETVWQINARVIDLGVILDQKIVDIVEGTDDNGDGEKENGIKQLSDFDTWKAEHVKDRLGWFRGTGGRDPDKGVRGAYFAKLIRLDTLIQKLLDQAVARIEGVTLNINYVYDTDTDIAVYPARWNCIKVPGEGDSDGTLSLRYCTFVSYSQSESFYLMPFRTYAGDYHILKTGGEAQGSPLVSWYLVDPIFPSGTEKSFTWINLTLTQLLQRLAYALGMVITLEPVSVTEINLKFDVRSNVGTTEFFIRDKIGDSSFKQSSYQSNKQQGYIGAAFSLCTEGPVYYRYDKADVAGVDTYFLQPDERKDDFYRSKIIYTTRPEESDKYLPLTFSPTSCLFGQDIGFDGGYDAASEGYHVLMPHNAVWYEGSNVDAMQRGKKVGDREVDNTAAWVEYNREDVHTAIYIFTTGRADEDGETGVEGLEIVSPVAYGVAKINGENVGFQKLGEYNRILFGVDEANYEGNLSFDVPGLNQFRQTPTGPASWKFALPGAKYMRDGVAWVLVEIDFEERRTKLRFQSINRFAYFQPVSGIESLEPIPKARPANIPNPQQIQDTGSGTGSAIPSGNFAKYNLVFVEKGVMYKATATSDNFDRNLYMALEGFDDEENVPASDVRYRSKGRVTLDSATAAALGLKKNDRLFLRNPGDGLAGLNWHTVAPDGSGGETLFCEWGYAESSTSIVIEPKRKFIIR